jgi:hypothetical protein
MLSIDKLFKGRYLDRDHHLDKIPDAQIEPEIPTPEASTGSDAWVQAIPERFEYNRRHRAYASYQEGSVQPPHAFICDKTAPDTWNPVLVE